MGDLERLEGEEKGLAVVGASVVVGEIDFCDDGVTGERPMLPLGLMGEEGLDMSRL